MRRENGQLYLTSERVMFKAARSSNFLERKTIWQHDYLVMGRAYVPAVTVRGLLRSGLRRAVVFSAPDLRTLGEFVVLRPSRLLLVIEESGLSTARPE